MIILLVTTIACCPGESWPAVEQATAAELRTLDAAERVTVIEEPGSSGEELARRRELSSLAAEHQAAAAVRLTARPGPDGMTEVDVWLVDRLSNKTVLRTFTVNREAPDSADVLALRVVELVRASLLEARLPDARVEPPRPPPSYEPLYALRFGFGALGTPNGTGAHGQLLLGARWVPLPQLAAELDFAVTVFGEDVAYHEAAASFDVFSARLWALWEVLSRGRFRPALGIGAGVAVCWSRGLGAPGYASSEGTTTAALLAGTAQLGIVLTRTLALRLTFRAGVTVPKTVVRFADHRVASFGEPYLDGSIGLELQLGSPP